MDEPIATYLPDFSIQPHPYRGGDYRNITTRMLLSHVSGIAADIISGLGSYGSHEPSFMNDFLPRLVQMHMDNAELARMSYANNGYTLLGILVAHMAGHDDFFRGYESFVKENIFAPAGMISTTYDVRYVSNVANPYTALGLPPAERIFANPISTGGLYTNAHDMARFMHLFLNGGSLDDITVLSEDSVRQMTQVQEFDFSLNPMIQFGLGVYQLTTPNGFVSIGHNGGWAQFHSEMQFHLESGIGVFVSVNSVTGARIVTALAEEILMAAVYEKTGSLDILEPLPPGVPTTMSREELERFTGFYTGIIGQISISDEGVLYAGNILGVPFPIEFTPYTDGSFGSIIGARFWFEEINGIMVLFQGDHRLVNIAERIDQFWPADENFITRWVGEYVYIDDPHGAVITIAVDENGYAVSFWGSPIVFPLVGVDNYTFFSSGTVRGYGGVIRFFEDEYGIWMEYAGARFLRK